MSHKLYFICILFAVHCSHAQHVDPKCYIASFRNNAEGAYTLIHDDFGGQWAEGIELYADTIAYNRAIPFCFALIAGECNLADWKKANEMIAHGHQVLNHSMYHKCGIEMEWCRAYWNEKDFHIEIDSSTSKIINNTGQHPAFFMFPFDQHTDTMISYLRSKGFSGARAGNASVEDTAIADPFYLNYKGFPPEQDLTDLDSFANEAISKKGWAIREVHGVNDGSWGVISLQEYEAHLNYLKSLVETDKIWVATLSDVLFYRLQKEKYSLVISKVDEQKRPVAVEFLTNPEITVKRDSVLVKTAFMTSKNHTLTVVMNQKKSRLLRILQNEKDIKFRLKKGQILFEADPEGGALSLFYKN